MDTGKNGKRTGGDRFRRLEEIFAEALSRPASGRCTYAAEACSGDLTLLSEIKAMLVSAGAEDGFLERDAFAIGAGALASGAFDVPTAIGGFTIIREIGRGGMGTVYLAERKDFRQQVALKVIKRGMDTDDIVRRFRQEREVLATLNHPNIARLLDGGSTDDGRPFLAMEYIQGRPITVYCDANRLSIDNRLAIFRKVCSAVSYAHANLVIHRDIKPSNVLIDADGEPKLLDFGIAKVIDPSRFETVAETTVEGMRMLTPEYAAPEQVLGRPVTTATDVYSLGVLLYELLSGHRPFSVKDRGVDEIIRLVSEAEPAAPSTSVTRGRIADPDTDEKDSPETLANARGERPDKLRRRLSGDLDNIVLTALRKEPQRRYGSVEQLSEDIGRHQSGLPVVARKQTFTYTAAKFIARHRVPAVFASLGLTAILFGGVVASWQAYRANVEHARAERRFNEIRQLANNLVSGWDKDIPEAQITSVVRARIADISAEYINNLAGETNDPELLKELIRANIKVGHDYAYASFDMVKAREALQNSVTLSRRLRAEQQGDVDATGILKDSLAAYSEANLEYVPDVIENTRERAALIEEIAVARPDDTRAVRDAAFEISHHGGILRDFGRQDEAAAQQKKALAIYNGLALKLEQASDPEAKRRLLYVYTSMAFRTARDLNDPASARPMLGRAVEIADEMYGANPNEKDNAYAMISTHYELGLLERELGDLDASDQDFQKSIEAVRHFNKIEVTGFAVRKEYDSLVDLATNQGLRGNTARAAALLTEAVNVRLRFASLPTQGDSAPTHAGNALLFFEVANEYRRIGLESRAAEMYRRAEAEYNRYFTMTRGRDHETLERADFLLAYGDQLAGVPMCTKNPPYYLEVARFDRYCSPEVSAPAIKDRGRLAAAAEKYRLAAEITGGLIESGAAAEHVIANSRIAAERLAAVSTFLQRGRS